MTDVSSLFRRYFNVLAREQVPENKRVGHAGGSGLGEAEKTGVRGDRTRGSVIFP